MSIESAKAFREYVQNNPHVEAEIRNTFLKEGSVDNSAIAKRYGYDFTVDEGNAAWAEVAEAGGELSDFELEMVSGGLLSEAIASFLDPHGAGKHPCNTSDSRFASENGNRAAGDNPNGVYE